MSERVEVERREAVELGDQPAVHVRCRGCDRDIVLHFNGGELDQKDCCGYRYALEHARIDLVVSHLT